MQNLELKVRCPDEITLDALEDVARQHGAAYELTMRQRDSYFIVAHGRLKVREWWQKGGNTGATLIAYARPDESGSRMSDYLLSPVAEPATLIAQLTRALGIWMVVEKVRVLYLYGHTRIHLDRVTGLGAFVELETVLGTDFLLEEATAEHQAVISFLDLTRFPIIAHSYSDLMKGSA